MTSTRRRLRTTAAGVLAGTLVLSGAAIAAPTAAHGDTSFELTRLAGEDRYGTAAAIARSTFTSAQDVVLASGAEESFPDALTSNYLAGLRDAPVLLTEPDALPSATREALRALGARRIFIVGGTAAVSASVEEDLRRAGYAVERLGGDDRYATAAAVGARFASATGSVGTIAGARTAVLATGQEFPDILAAAPLSFSNRLPLVLTLPTAVPAVTLALLRQLAVTRVVVVGGTAAVSSAVEDQLRALPGLTTVTRVAGTDRYSTATAVADFAVAELGYTTTHVHLARGDAFADALAGGPHGGREKAAILLTSPTRLHDVTRAWLSSNSATLRSGQVFGGVSAVGNDVARAAVTAGQGRDLTVTLASSTIVPGGTIAGTITGTITEAVYAVSAAGCGVPAEELGGDSDPSSPGRQFTLPVPAGLAAGACTLTITAVPAGGGAAVTRTLPLTVVSAPTPPPPAPPPADTSGPGVAAQSAAPEAGATSVVFTADEPLLAGSVQLGDFTVEGGTSQAGVRSVSVSGATITVTTTPLVEGNVVTLRAGSVTDPTGNAGPVSDVRTAATTGTLLVARWNMEDTDRTMRDSSGRGHDGTLSTNVLTGQPGFPGSGSGYGFPRTPAFVTVPDAADLDPGAQDFSFTVRVRFSAPPAGQDVDGLDQNTFDILRKGLASTAGGNYKLEILSSGAAHCLFAGPGGTYAVTSAASLADDQWHTITCGRTAGRVVLTVDGAERSTAHQLGTVDNDEPLMVGARTGNGDDQYLGLLDRVEVRKG